MQATLPVLALCALLASGCASPTVAGPAAQPGRDLHLYVSNQSFDQPTADILVTVDGLVAFDGEAKVEGQHNWMLRELGLAPGTHRIEALERDTGTRASVDFDLPAGKERWAVVDYWNPTGPGKEPGFTVSVHEEQVHFA